MKIKRYVAPDMRQAIRQVREEQGPDAVILSNRQVDGGVEIVAAMDYEAFLSEIGAGKPAAATAARHAAAGGATATGAAGAAPEIAAMQRELQTLRGMLEHQLSDLAWGEAGRRHPRRALLVRRLRELGLSAALAQEVAAAVQEHADVERTWREALAVLAHRLPVTNDEILNTGGVVALVGPTGVGKTTTVAKLAARFILRHGPDSVGLMTTDDQRIGAQEQLRIYGKILNTPVRAAHNAAALAAALAEMHGRRLVLIDTAGLGQRDLRLQEQIELIRCRELPIRSYLVLAATTQLSGIEEIVATYRPMSPQGCIVTKIDETTSLGGVLSVAQRHRLPLAYLSEGQRVPEDLRPARAHDLVARCVAIALQTRRRLEAPAGPRRRLAHAC
jgi:flagellar biosynthesis protein FlhF